MAVSSTRLDPYKNFKFRVLWEGTTTPVAGISKVSGLKKTTEVVKHREGNDPSSSRKSPGKTEFEAITLERGGGRHQQSERLEEDHRGGETPRGERSEQQPEIAGQDRVRSDHPRARRWPASAK